MLKFICLVACIFPVTGCSAVRSEAITPVEDEVAPSQGMSYFLPMRQVKVTIVCSAEKLSDLRAKANDAANARDVAGKVLDDAQANLDTAKKNSDSAPGNVDLKKAYDAARIRADTAVLIHQRLQKEAEAAQQLYDTSLIAPTSYRETASIELQPSVPDPRRMFVATLNHVRFGFSDDEMSLETTETGLLKTAGLTRTDQTGAVLLALVDTYATLAIGGAGPPGANAFVEPSKPTAEKSTFHFEALVDPTDRRQVDEVNENLKSLRSDLRIACTQQKSAEEAASVSAKALGVHASGDKLPQRIDGLAYRRPLPYTVAINQVIGDNKEIPISAATVLLPNAAPISVLPYETGMFTKSEYDLAFADGSLVMVRTSRPSEVLGFARILPNAAKEIVSIPAEILQLKVDTTKNQTDLLEQQKKLIDAQKALQDAKASGGSVDSK